MAEDPGLKARAASPVPIRLPRRDRRGQPAMAFPDLPV